MSTVMFGRKIMNYDDIFAPVNETMESKPQENRKRFTLMDGDFNIICSVDHLDNMAFEMGRIIRKMLIDNDDTLYFLDIADKFKTIKITPEGMLKAYLFIKAVIK